MLGSGLDIGVVVAGSALLLISLIIFFYALWTYRASKANVTPPERASTHLEVSTRVRRAIVVYDLCGVRLRGGKRKGRGHSEWGSSTDYCGGRAPWNRRQPASAHNRGTAARPAGALSELQRPSTTTCVVTVCQTRYVLGFLRDIGSTAGVSVALVGLLPLSHTFDCCVECRWSFPLKVAATPFSQQDVPLNIAPVANVAQINISVDSEGSTVHEGEHARQVLQESGLYDLAAPSPRNELAPSPADTYRAVPAEPSFRVPGPPPFEPPQLQPAQSPARDESHDPDHEVQARDEVRLSQPSRSPDEAVATTQHPALDTLDPELGVRSRSRPVSNAEVSYVGWSDSDDEVDPKEEGRQLYPSPPNTDSTQGSMDDVRAPPLTSAPIDRAEVHVDPHDEPPVAAAGAPTEPTPSPETPWVDGAEAETEGYGGVGAEPGSRDTLDKGERMATLDRIAQNSARREAVAEERRRKLAEDYAAAEAERAKLAAEELERILEEERMRKEAEEAKKYAGIEEAQQRLAELPFTFSFTMDESPKKADPTTGVSSTMSRKSKKSPPKATVRSQISFSNPICGLLATACSSFPCTPC